MKIEIDGNSGFCFGVINAIRMAEQVLEKKEQLFCLGDIVHNEAEVGRLNKMGMVVISREEFFQLSHCTVLIRAHGEPPEIYRHAAENGIDLIDATCPVVLYLQKRVKTSFEETARENGQIVIFGKPGHAEIQGINGQINNHGIIVKGVEDLRMIDPARPVELYSQTTMSDESYGEIARLIRLHVNDELKVNVHNTVCRQVSSRGPHLKQFAQKYDLVIFVAGINSSNGAVLFEICKNANQNSFRVDAPEKINPEWFEKVSSVGICGATSTPRWLMEQVAAWIEENIVASAAKQ